MTSKVTKKDDFLSFVTKFPNIMQLTACTCILRQIFRFSKTRELTFTFHTLSYHSIPILNVVCRGIMTDELI